VQYIIKCLPYFAYKTSARLSRRPTPYCKALSTLATIVAGVDRA